MSNAKHETVADIVAEMRSNEFDDPRFNVYSLVAARTLARGWADRIEAAAKREVAELRECLKEAIREKCPFTRMSCKHGETCDYECGTVKWRKALREKGGAK